MPFTMCRFVIQNANSIYQKYQINCFILFRFLLQLHKSLGSICCKNCSTMGLKNTHTLEFVFEIKLYFGLLLQLHQSLGTKYRLSSSLRAILRKTVVAKEQFVAAALITTHHVIYLFRPCHIIWEECLILECHPCCSGKMYSSSVINS